MNHFSIKSLLFFVYVFLFLGNIANAQIDSVVLRRVYTNIQGYELKDFLNDSESLKTEIIIDMIDRLHLQCQLSFEEIPVEMDYPKKEFSLFSFRKKGVDCDDYLITKTTYDEFKYDFFLIGIDTSSNKSFKPVKYISGHMFLDNISDDFKLDIENPMSYIEYLKFRMFYLGVKQLKFLEIKEKVFYYQGYSSVFNKKLRLSIDTKSWKNKVKIEKWL